LPLMSDAMLRYLSRSADGLADDPGEGAQITHPKAEVSRLI
jgi:hypothetical protein